RTEQMHPRGEIQLLDPCLKRFAQRPVANDVADKVDSAARKVGASVDQMLKSLECNEAANADDARHEISRQRGWRRKPVEIDPIINPMNFRCRIGTTLTEEIATVIGFGRDKFRRTTDLAKQIVAAEVFHKILAVRCDAERN